MAKLSDVFRQIALDSFSKPFRLYNWHLFLFFNNEIYICMGVLLLYTSVPRLLLVLLEARSGHWIPWKWSYRQLRQLWATMWELNPGCLEEKSVLLTAEPTNSPALAINISSGLSVVPFVLFLTETFLQTKNSELGHKCWCFNQFYNA